MLQQIDPEVVVVLGTRIIASAVLESVECPFVNLHAGITPRYRGLHGVYWALSEGRPDLAGTTVHVVDAGIDTGTVLGRAYVSAGPEDSIATYPYVGLVAGLPVLVDQVERLLAEGRNGLGHPGSTEPRAIRRPSSRRTIPGCGHIPPSGVISDGGCATGFAEQSACRIAAPISLTMSGLSRGI